jgi:hypothetical protein
MGKERADLKECGTAGGARGGATGGQGGGVRGRKAAEGAKWRSGKEACGWDRAGIEWQQSERRELDLP